MASQGFSDAAMGGDYTPRPQAESEKSQPPPPPPYNPTAYGYDQPGDGISGPKPYSSSNPTGYGYNQPGDRDPRQPYGFGQPGYTSPYTTQPGVGNQTNIVVSSSPGIIVAPMRENTPPPDTSCGLVISILVLFFCAWPCGIGAIIANRNAKTFVDLGQHSQARQALSRMWVWVFTSILFGLGVWIYVGFRIKATFDDANRMAEEDHYYYSG